jgi:hypothetical protein
MHRLAGLRLLTDSSEPHQSWKSDDCLIVSPDSVAAPKLHDGVRIRRGERQWPCTHQNCISSPSHDHASNVGDVDRPNEASDPHDERSRAARVVPVVDERPLHAHRIADDVEGSASEENGRSQSRQPRMPLQVRRPDGVEGEEVDADVQPCGQREYTGDGDKSGGSGYAPYAIAPMYVPAFAHCSTCSSSGAS